MKTPPRSTLHSLEPLGVGTTATESLLSYFCRLAVSHAVSTDDLARFIASEVDLGIRPDFSWQQRNLAGVSDSANHWSAWLSAMTGIGRLDLLTLANWSEVVSPRGLAARGARWCPHCLMADREEGRDPYFRLSWDVGLVEACPRHKVVLGDSCPHCGKRNVRHHAGIVVPGWCSRCGGFLGDAEVQPATPRQQWVARQVEAWIAAQASMTVMPSGNSVLETLNTLILGLDGGQPARFAKRLGLAKSTVHNWLKLGGKPGLESYLVMAAHSGLTLEQVLRGDVAGWAPPAGEHQMAMPFDLTRSSPCQARHHDWDALRNELQAMLRAPEPISVAEAGRRLGVDDRHLYLRANEQARALGARWKQYQASCKDRKRAELKAQLVEVYPAMLEQGQCLNLMGATQGVTGNVLNSVEGVFDVLREVRETCQGVGSRNAL